MLRDGTVEVEAAWTQEATAASYREIDRQLRAIAQKKASLDVEEAKWLREAERHRVWRKLGFSTALEYLEDVFGYAPRTAKDRLRVAKELGELPGLEAELRTGGLPYSAARELSRVMTPATEAQWLAHARGKNVHEIETLVTGHKKGAEPDDPPLIAARRPAQRKQALVQSGYTAAVAQKAVEVARAHVGTEADLPTLLKEAVSVLSNHIRPEGFPALASVGG